MLPTITLDSGYKMPMIGLGTWQLTGDAALESVKYALGLGYRMIDTSGDYKNQSEIGKAVRENGVPREEIFLVTKVEENDDAYDKTCKDLRELGFEYADLMLIHRPPKHGAGRELWEGLIRARDDELTRDIGISNYPIDEIEELIQATRVVPAVNQIEWSPFGYSHEMLDYCNRNEIIIQGYSPLTRNTRLDEEKLIDLATKYKKTPAQIMIRWAMQHRVVPIPKASTREHLKENIDVLDFAISSHDMERLDNYNEQYSALAEKPLYVSS